MRKILFLLTFLFEVWSRVWAADVVLYSYIDGTETINTSQGVNLTIISASDGNVAKDYKGQKYNANSTTPTGTITFSAGIVSAGAIANALKLEITGGFKTGDVIKIRPFINNSNEAKYANVDLYSNATTKVTSLTNNGTSSSPTVTDGRRTAGIPAEFSYTLTSNYTELYIGRGSADTRVNLYSIIITRADASVLDAPTISQNLNQITMTAADGATIYYTLDGTSPSTSSSVYDSGSKPIITNDCTVKAYAVKDGMTDSEVSTFMAKYVIASNTLINFNDEGYAVGSSYNGVYIGGGCTLNSSGTIYPDGLTLPKRVQCAGDSQNATRYLNFNVLAPCNIIVYHASNSSGNMKGFNISTGTYASGDGNTYGYNIGGYGDAVYYEVTGDGVKTVNISNGKAYGASGGTVMCIYGIKVVYGSTNSYTMTIGSTGYASLSLPYAVIVPDGVVAYKGTSNGSTVTLTKVAEAGEVLPANAAVVVAGTGSKTFVQSTATPVLITENAFSGTPGNSLVISDDAVNTYYVLAANSSGDAVLAQVSNVTYKVIPSNKAYLSIADGGSARELSFVVEDGQTTGIRDVKGDKISSNCYYNLNGQKVQQPTKGLYIMNGKKVVVK